MFNSKVLVNVGLMFVLCSCSAETVKSPPNPSDSATLLSTHEGDQTLTSFSLDQLWKHRLTKATDFPIGSGDVLEISVAGLEGADGQYSSAADGHSQESSSAETFRVDGLGDIVLPLVGRIHAAGLTEEELRAELIHRLDRYMYDPDVKIFVKSYTSRETAVSGEVHSPGMYTVNGPGETIYDLIMRAGGSTPNAARKVILTPAKDNGSKAPSPSLADSTRLSPPSADSLLGRQAADAALNTTSYVIDFSQHRSAERYLGLPVRPGDTLYVPRAGSVTVTGWVYTPKSVEITPGLTVLGVVSSAGGPLFAADATQVKILRQGAGRETKTVVVNLNDIKAARTPDVLVQANDIVDVPYSTLRIPGYAAYYGVKGMVEFAPAMLLVGGGP